jgi:hypothetical protein
MNMKQFANKVSQQWELASQNWDFVAVLAGISVGFAVIIITRLIAGPHTADWFGPAMSAALTASQVTRSRQKKSCASSGKDHTDPVELI